MSDKDVILTVAKVIIAAAWADGEISQEEKNSLKDLLFRLPQTSFGRRIEVTARDWAMLDMYLETPVDDAERTHLIEQLQDALRTPKDKKLVAAALDSLIHADGKATSEELAVETEIKRALDHVDVGIFSQMGRLLSGVVQRRSQAVANAPSREKYLEDFIKNKVYYSVQRRLNLEEAELDIPEETLRKLSLAGAVMARVAHVDHEVTENEFDTMVRALEDNWEMERETAVFVAEIAVAEMSSKLDYYRMMREFATTTTEKERTKFLDVLLTVAAADGEISHEENEEIRTIARSLNLPTKEFGRAKRRYLNQRAGN